MIKVVAVHTAMALVEPMNQIFRQWLPEVKLNHIADDSLIQEVIANDGVTPAVRRRLLSYYVAAADSGASVVFNTCSSVGDIADFSSYATAAVSPDGKQHPWITAPGATLVAAVWFVPF